MPVRPLHRCTKFSSYENNPAPKTMDCEFACELLYLERVCRCNMSTPYLTLTLACALVCVYLAGCGFSDCVAYQGALALPSGADPWSYRTVAMALSHASWFHLLLNLLSMGPFLIVIEAVHGPARLTGIVLSAAYFGSLNFIWNGRTGVEVVGASAVAYGLTGAYVQSIVVNGAWKRRTRRKLVARIMLLLGQAVLEVVVAVYVADNVATSAHLGGLLAGFAAGLILLSQHYAVGGAFAAMCLVLSKYAGL